MNHPNRPCDLTDPSIAYMCRVKNHIDVLEGFGIC
jgi:hypothetical protein